MPDPKRTPLSRRAWLSGALALACSRTTEAPAGGSANPQGGPPGATLHPTSTTLHPTSTTHGSKTVGPGIAVVELFTSQGCSSCPPADRVLRELTEEDDASVLTLSFHVDYWNYLGWADPYSSARYSARQRSYAAHLSGGRVFTPQAIVNGRHSALGSAQSEIEDLIRMEKQVAAQARIELAFGDGELSYRATTSQGDLKITLLLLQNSVHNAVLRGENSGEDLRHVHVVRGLFESELGSGVATGGWKPDLARLTPKSTGGDGNLSAAALVSDKSGAIVGAKRIPIA